MWESSSTGSRDREGDTEGELDRLRDTNNELMRENSQLRAQFETAASNAERVSSIQAKNTALKTENRKLMGVSDEVSRRLEVASRAIGELEFKLREAHEQSETTRNNENAGYKRELESLQLQNRRSEDRMVQELEEAKAENMQTKFEYKSLNSKLAQIMASASFFFKRDITTIEQTIAVLNEVTIARGDDAKKIDMKYEMPSCRVEKVEVRSKADKRKLQAAEHKCSEHMKAVLELKREIEAMKRLNARECAALKRDLETVKEESNVIIAQKDAMITQLTKKIAVFDDELQKRKQQLIRLADEIGRQPRSPVVEQRSTHVVNEDEHLLVEQLNERVNELTQQLATAKVQKDETIVKLVEAEKARDRAVTDVSKMESSLTALKTVHEERVKEAETLREIVSDREKTAKLERVEQRELKRAKGEIDTLKRQTAAHAREIESLQTERETLRNARQQLEMKVREQRDEISRESYHMTSLKEEVERLKVQHASRPQLSANDLIPSTAFQCSEMPNSVAQQVSQIAENRVLTPHSKIQSILRLMCDHFNKDMKSMEQKMTAEKSEKDDVFVRFDNFAAEMAIKYSIQRVNSADVGVILKKTDDVVKLLDEQGRTIKTMNAVFDRIVELFGSSGGHDMRQKVEEVHKELTATRDALHETRKKYRKVKGAFRALSGEKCTSDEAFGSKIAELSDICASLEETNEELTTIRRKQKSDISSLRKELANVIQHRDDNEARMCGIIESLNEQLASEQQQGRTQLADQTRDFDNKMIACQEELEGKNRVIQSLKKTIQIQKTTISEKNTELDDLCDKHRLEMKSSRKKYESDKQSAIDAYERTAADLSRQFESARRDLKQLNADVTDETAKRNKLQKANVRLKADVARLSRELQTASERLDRDRRLSETTLKSSMCNLEASFDQREADLRTRYETEKNIMFAFVADEFRQFCDVSRSLDERAFQSVVSKVREELTRLSNSEALVRRITGAAVHQTIEDIVQQLVLNR